MARIGVLALQGDFAEHITALRRLGVKADEVRLPHQVEPLDGLIIPGGESTTIGKLAAEYGLLDAIRRLHAQGKPIWGTCAGMIVLAKNVRRGLLGGQPILGLMDITVDRNAFGRQVDSFEIDLEVSALGGEPFHAVFIRAPLITAVGPGVEVLARLSDGGVVAAQQGRLLATAFHPELTGDTRFHEYFLRLATR
jgi:5'-phosphate synthase pdxT subunit